MKLQLFLAGLIVFFAATMCAEETPAEEPASNLAPLVGLLTQIDDAEFQLDILSGIHQAVKGRRQLAMPKGWPAAYAKLEKSPNEQVREKATLLAVMFGDRTAIDRLRKLAVDSAATSEVRTRAIAALAQRKDRTVVTLLYELLDDAVVRGTALQGLSTFDDQRTAGEVLTRYDSFTSAEKQAAIATLTARAENALALLGAMDAGKIPPSDLSAYSVRQLSTFGDPRIDGLLEKVWGTIRPTTADKKELIEKYKKLLAARNDPPDAAAGRRVYAKTCAACHRLFGAGGQVGPDLTGSQRKNVDYLLENLLDPNAVVGRDYQVTVISTEGGRVLSGLVREENDRTLTLQTPTETIIVPAEEIAERKKSPLSMMPEGLMEKLTDAEMRGLFTYLASPTQVEMPSEQPVSKK